MPVLVDDFSISIADLHGLQEHQLSGDGGTVNIKDAGKDTTYVVVRYARFEMPDGVMRMTLSCYGNVIEVRPHHFTSGSAKSDLTGNCTVAMKMLAGIPSSLKVARTTVHVACHGQERICFRCRMSEHS